MRYANVGLVPDEETMAEAKSFVWRSEEDDGYGRVEIGNVTITVPARNVREFADTLERLARQLRTELLMKRLAQFHAEAEDDAA